MSAFSFELQNRQTLFPIRLKFIPPEPIKVGKRVDVNFDLKFNQGGVTVVSDSIIYFEGGLWERLLKAKSIVL